MYLRENLLLDGGDHIISKYSRRAPETTVTRKIPKKIKRARTVEQEAARNALPSRTVPARLFQDQGGIEGIIHEAAKGVYSRGEKWGVGKALRGAMQGLQSGRSSPRRASERSRTSLDSGRPTSDNQSELAAKIQALERRNKSLSKLLENAVDELWTQQKQIHDKENETVADALGLSIAKVQFVQVYLENSTMPLPTDEAPPLEEIRDGTASVSGEESRTPLLHPKLLEDPISVESSLNEKAAEVGKSTKVAERPDREIPKVYTDPPPSTPKIGSPSKPSSPPPRPSLEQSPFSWMLGDGQTKSKFVSAASPFSPNKSSGHSQNLFGDSKQHQSRQDQDRPSMNGQSDGNDDRDDDDVFTMALSKGRRQR